MHFSSEVHLNLWFTHFHTAGHNELMYCVTDHKIIHASSPREHVSRCGRWASIGHNVVKIMHVDRRYFVKTCKISTYPSTTLCLSTAVLIQVKKTKLTQQKNAGLICNSVLDNSTPNSTLHRFDSHLTQKHKESHCDHVLYSDMRFLNIVFFWVESFQLIFKNQFTVWTIPSRWSVWLKTKIHARYIKCPHMALLERMYSVTTIYMTNDAMTWKNRWNLEPARANGWKEPIRGNDSDIPWLVHTSVRTFRVSVTSGG